MKHILVVGSTNTDMIIRVPRIPKPGETVLGGEFAMAPGGKGANQAVALAEKRSLPDALWFAQAAAAISVTRPGAQPSAPTRAEVEAFLR